MDLDQGLTIRTLGVSFQIGVFIYEAVLLSKEGKPMGPNGPVYREVKPTLIKDRPRPHLLSERPIIRSKKEGGSLEIHDLHVCTQRVLSHHLQFAHSGKIFFVNPLYYID